MSIFSIIWGFGALFDDFKQYLGIFSIFGGFSAQFMSIFSSIFEDFLGLRSIFSAHKHP